MAVVFCFFGYTAEQEAQPEGLSCAEKAKLIQTVDQALSDKDSLWVLIVNKGKVHSALYDIRDTKTTWSLIETEGPGIRIFDPLWGLSRETVTVMLSPVLDTLQNHALCGYKKKRFKRMQRDFSAEMDVIGRSLNPKHYKRQPFFSVILRKFFTKRCPDLLKNDLEIGGGFGQPITAALLQQLTPDKDHLLQFSLEKKQNFIDEVSRAKESDPIKVFMPLPGFDVLRGAPIKRRCWHSEEISNKCFFYHKIRALGNAFCDLYRLPSQEPDATQL